MVTTIELEEVENQMAAEWPSFSNYYAELSEQEPINKVHNITSASCEFEYSTGKNGLINREAIFAIAPPQLEKNWNQQQQKYYQNLCAYHEVLDAQQSDRKIGAWVDASESYSDE